MFDEDEEQNESTTWLVSFDTDGFEAIINVTEAYMEEAMEALVSDNFKSKLDSTLMAMKLRARFNAQRNPQIYTFVSSGEIDEETLRMVADENPQFLADWIRLHGSRIYGEKMVKDKRKINL